MTCDIWQRYPVLAIIDFLVLHDLGLPQFTDRHPRIREKDDCYNLFGGDSPALCVVSNPAKC